MIAERAFVISLPFRTDRLDAFREQTSGIACLPEIEVWPAVHGDTCLPPDSWQAGNGAWGCYKSHLNILEHCLNNRVSSYIVFEDDAQIRDGFEDYAHRAFGELPDDWEQCYLGGQLMHVGTHPPVKFSDRLHRPFNVNRTHCFAVSRAGMVPIYKHLSQLPFAAHDHIDHHLGRWHEDDRNKVYCFSQWMVGQHGSSSNVSGKNEPVQFYENAESVALSHWLYETPVVILFRGSNALLRECLGFLHFGDTINASGYDVTLHEASKYRYPGPSINRWFGWIRSEIAKQDAQRVPAVFHPDITEKQIREHACNVIITVEHAANAQEVKRQIQQQAKGTKAERHIMEALHV